MTSEAERHLQALDALFREIGSVLVCFSGGIDSAFVLCVASRALGERAVGITAVSPSLPERERLEASALARELGVRHECVDTSELARPGYAANGPDRCFHCKSELYDVAAREQQRLGLSVIVNGTNLDDLGDYRPGLEAAKNAGVRSPLVEVGMTKAQVRAAAKALGMRLWDKPAAACLSSRIPYGTAVTPERLRQIEGFESALLDLGFPLVRVRHHDTIARIEVPLADLPRLASPELAPRLYALGQAHGFRYVTLDLAGYRTGSHNEVLTGKSRSVALPVVS